MNQLIINNLKKAIKEYILEDPKRVSEILSIVSESLKEYESKIKEDRDGKMFNTLSMALGFLSEKSKKNNILIPSLIDAMYYLFPKATLKKANNCESDKKLLKNFLKKAQEQNYPEAHKDWIIESKGQAVYDWFVKIMKEYKKGLK